MTEHQSFVDMVRTIVRAEISHWQHPTDAELRDLWEKRIKFALEKLEQELGDDGK